MEAAIVIIDNDQSMRDLLSMSLKRKGWAVFAYPYADIYKVLVEQQPPDLIILDFNLRDEVIGWEFLQFIKMEDRTAKIPVLITTTAFSLSAEVQEYLLSRYIKIVRKPFDLIPFLALVEKTITMASRAGELFSGDRTLPILVVEDTEDLRETIKTVLMLEGYRVVSANDGQVALDILFQGDYCLILLGLAMPSSNGLKFLNAYDQQLRPHSPVIILNAEEEVRLQVLPTFVVDVLLKPFQIDPLLEQVRKFGQPVGRQHN